MQPRRPHYSLRSQARLFNPPNSLVRCVDGILGAPWRSTLNGRISERIGDDASAGGCGAQCIPLRDVLLQLHPHGGVQISVAIGTTPEHQGSSVLKVLFGTAWEIHRRLLRYPEISHPLPPFAPLHKNITYAIK